MTPPRKFLGYWESGMGYGGLPLLVWGMGYENHPFGVWGMGNVVWGIASFQNISSSLENFWGMGYENGIL